MSLSYVLLTSLLEKPCTGSELARRFDRSIGFFWTATHQQIYRELATMLTKGWISTLEDDSPLSRKKTYQVEQLGRTELANWMLKQSPPAQLREELLVRLRAEAQCHTQQLLPELERHLKLHQEKLKLYQTIYEKDFSHTNSHDKTLFLHKMILDLGIRLEHGWIEWLEELIPALQNFNE